MLMRYLPYAHIIHTHILCCKKYRFAAISIPTAQLSLRAWIVWRREASFFELSLLLGPMSTVAQTITDSLPEYKSLRDLSERSHSARSVSSQDQIVVALMAGSCFLGFQTASVIAHLHEAKSLDQQGGIRCMREWQYACVNRVWITVHRPPR
jgi:hypothetical protein